MKDISWAVNLCKTLNFQVGKLRLREEQLELGSWGWAVSLSSMLVSPGLFIQHTPPQAKAVGREPGGRSSAEEAGITPISAGGDRQD